MKLAIFLPTREPSARIVHFEFESFKLYSFKLGSFQIDFKSESRVVNRPYAQLLVATLVGG